MVLGAMSRPKTGRISVLPSSVQPAPELAPFGVRVCASEPGGMRTNWGKRASAGVPKLFPEYEPSVGFIIKRLEDHWGHEMSDPAKVAQVILQLASEERLPAHFLLGSDVCTMPGLRRTSGNQTTRTWHHIGVSTDMGYVKGLTDLKF